MAALANGYDDRRLPAVLAENRADIQFDDDRLELIYAGRLYGYRDPTPLLLAVARTPGVRLTLVVPDPPAGEAAIHANAGDQLRLLGSMPHDHVQGLLRRADILVNFGDQGQPVRTPAKLYEYLGIARPILHVHGDTSTDAATTLLQDLGRGWLCSDVPDLLAAKLVELRELKKHGRLQEGLSLGPVHEYAHSSLGLRLERLLEESIDLRRQKPELSRNGG